jgi:hypothetical protein
MAQSTCFDPLAFPFVRAQTYVDPNPPAVLADEFFNPTQDALARFYGAAVGYSTSLVNDEFVLPRVFGFASTIRTIPARLCGWVLPAAVLAHAWSPSVR